VPKYNNPPVIEAWIAFDFEPKADKIGWDLEQVKGFAKAYPDFATMGAFFKEEIRLEKKDDKSLPTITSRSNTLDVARMSNEENTRLRQLANDRIAYNLLRKAGDEYPGFKVLLDEALEFHKHYEKFFQPANTKNATIHYVDIVDIPTDGIPIVLTDYFGFIPDIPEEPFGFTIGYSLAFVTKCPFDSASMQTTLAWIPSPDANVMRIRMDWEKPCPAVDYSDTEKTKAGLKQSQQFMVDCFEKVITDKTRELFG
jgi:uncharacterized protein (TIGR04255 family)